VISGSSLIDIECYSQTKKVDLAFPLCSLFCAQIMALVVNLKSFDGLPGRADRIVKLTFRG